GLATQRTRPHVIRSDVVFYPHRSESVAVQTLTKDSSRLRARDQLTSRVEAVTEIRAALAAGRQSPVRIVIPTRRSVAIVRVGRRRGIRGRRHAITVLIVVEGAPGSVIHVVPGIVAIGLRVGPGKRTIGRGAAAKSSRLVVSIPAVEITVS